MAHRAFSDFITTKPHDYLYSTIGLCGGGELLPAELKPDYHKPFPLVCEDYARCAIKATGRVDILGRSYNNVWVDYEQKLAERLPFGVPDFRAAQIGSSVWEASNVSFVGPNERILKARGLEVGKIIEVLLPLPFSEGSEDFNFREQLRHHHHKQ
jgi:hypothetical protein